MNKWNQLNNSQNFSQTLRTEGKKQRHTDSSTVIDKEYCQLPRSQHRTGPIVPNLRKPKNSPGLDSSHFRKDWTDCTAVRERRPRTNRPRSDDLIQLTVLRSVSDTWLFVQFSPRTVLWPLTLSPPHQSLCVPSDFPGSGTVGKESISRLNYPSLFGVKRNNNK